VINAGRTLELIRSGVEGGGRRETERNRGYGGRPRKMGGKGAAQREQRRRRGKEEEGGRRRDKEGEGGRRRGGGGGTREGSPYLAAMAFSSSREREIIKNKLTTKERTSCPGSTTRSHKREISSSIQSSLWL
jgi:hypothetical protein